MQDKLALIDRMERIFQEAADSVIDSPNLRHCGMTEQREMIHAIAGRKLRDVLDDLKAEALIEDAHTTQAMHDFFAIHEDARLEHSA